MPPMQVPKSQQAFDSELTCHVFPRGNSRTRLFTRLQERGHHPSRPFVPPIAWRTDFLYEHWDNDDDPETSIPTLAGVRNDRFKYIEYVTGETELYDLAVDPYELENQSSNSAYAKTKTALAARLLELRPDWSP
jgi:hypothetical protein